MAAYNNMFLSATLAVIAAIVLMMAGNSKAEWPPHCAGFTKLVTKPCLDYVTGNATEVPKPCCEGLATFTADAKKSTAKRRAGCYCVKQSAMNPDYEKGRIQNVATTCGYKLPNPTLDCQTVP